MSNLNGCCKNCGEYYHGDRYTKVLHCPNAKDEKLDCVEPDASPVDCELS